MLEEYVFWWCKALKTVTMGDVSEKLVKGHLVPVLL